MSKPSRNSAIQQHLAEKQILPNLFVSHPRKLAHLAHASFEAEEGRFEASPNLMITLCTGFGGRFVRNADNALLETNLTKGTVAVALPYSPAIGCWAKTDLLGLSINLDACSKHYQLDYSRDNFIPAASKVHKDPLLNALLDTVWRDSELHGSSSCFFDEGIQQILSRLTDYSLNNIVDRVVMPLQGKRLFDTIDLIENHISDDISIAELAQNVQQDVRTFSRAFKTTFACAPYAYLTQRRMIRAQQLLLTKISITDIASAVGYTNPSKFSAAFRRYIGIPPSQWRSQRH